ncbi:MAG: hypothetical protein ACYCVB_13135 [Bacilli bacterium]
MAKSQSYRCLASLAVLACTTASLAGCGSIAALPSAHAHAHAHAKSKSPAHALRRQAVQPLFHPLSLPFTLQANGGPSAGTLAPIRLRNAFETTSNIITVDGARYTLVLKAGSALLYAPTPHGIVWTVVPVNARAPADAGGFYGKIYLTPYSSPPLLRRPFSLVATAQVIYQAPVYKAGKNRFASRLQLYQFWGGALFSQTQPLGTEPRTTRYMAAPFASAPVTLFSTTANSGPPTLLGPFGDGVLYAATSPDKGQFSARTIIYNDFSSGKKITLTPKYSQFTAVAQNGNALIVSGSQTLLIAPDGRVVQSLTPANPGVAGAQRILRDTALPYLYLPALDLAPHAGRTARGALQTLAEGQYRIRLFDKSGRLICQVTVAAQKEQNPGSKDAPGRPRANAPGGPFALTLSNYTDQPAIPGFFGKQRAQHTFTLQSAEGPLIQWIQSSQHASGSSDWYASFYLQSWRYVIGPFTNLSDSSQTRLLSQFITLMMRSGPLSDTGGEIYVHVQRLAGAYTYGASEVSFFPSSGVHVRLDSPGLASLGEAAHFTLVAP